MLIPPSVSTEKTVAKRDTSDGSPAELPIFIARPKDGNKEIRPVIMLLQEAFGINEHIQDVCERFARQGYIVVSPDLYYRTGAWQNFDYAQKGANDQAKAVLTEERVVGDFSATLEFINTLEGADSSRVGVVGYCMGGRFSFMTACYFSNRIKTAAIYYGGGITTESPEFPVPIIQKSNQIKVPVIGFFGGQDKGIPESVVKEIEQSLQVAGVENEIFYYPQAGHGFHCNVRPAYDPVSAHDAWHRTLQWFADKLGPIAAADWRS